MAFSNPAMLALWRLKGLPMTSCSLWPGVKPSGGVPAFADNELTDCGVSAESASSLLTCDDFRIEFDSWTGSAEC